MRIAILGSVALPVPPPAQGGTEWIAYWQAKGFARAGHQVLLLASRGSTLGEYELLEVGGGDTVAGSKLNIADKNEFIESSRSLRKETVYLSEVIDILSDRKADFDIILNNMRGEAVFVPFAKLMGKEFVNVLHLPLFAELAYFFKRHNSHLISISNNQRKTYQDLNYISTVYNGVDLSKFTMGGNHGDYLLMMGTIGRHKNQMAAIRVAKKLEMKLIIAGKVRDRDYFEEMMKEVDGERIIYKGELEFAEKLTLYQNAKAFIFPIVWEEPFGLVMIEAAACGTPVVAFNNGAVPEVVVDGKTGFVIEGNSEEGMVEAIRKIDSIKREDCRKHVEENFSVEKMVSDYERALLQITGNR